MTILFLAIILLTLMILSYNRVPLVVSVIILFVITVVLTRLRLVFPTPTGFRWAFGIITVTLMGFSIKPLRRLLISDRLFSVYRKVMPSMSSTERDALEARRGLDLENISPVDAFMWLMKIKKQLPD